MALALCLGEDVGGRRLGAAIRLPGDVGGQCDRVGAGEADPVDLGQRVGILVQDAHRLGPVAGVDRRREVGEPVGGEVDVEVADGPARVPGLRGGLGLALADPAQRTEGADRIGGDRVEHGGAVVIAQALGPGRPDVAQRGQIGDLPLPVGRVDRLRPERLHLGAVARVLLPLAAHLRPLARPQVAHGPDQDQLVAGLLVEHLEHRVAVVLGAEDLVADRDDRLEGAGGEGRLSVDRAHLPEVRARARRRHGPPILITVLGVPSASAAPDGENCGFGDDRGLHLRAFDRRLPGGR